MKKSENKTYHIQSINKHLINILEENYYLELGNVDLNVLHQLLNGEEVSFNQMYDYHILTNGIGQITKEEDDARFQFNYLYELHQKSSSSKFVLTCGVAKHLDNTGVEIYAPIVLIPLNLDYLNLKFVMDGAPRVNNLFIHHLKRKYRRAKVALEQKKLETTLELEINDLNEQINKLTNLISNLETIKASEIKLPSIFEIDMFCKRFSEITSLSIDTTNYLTIMQIEYPEYIDKKGIFSYQPSICDTSDYDIMTQYFAENKGIVTCNIDQKYITNKAHQGNSLAITGRLGSGKTQTAINIIGDFLSQGKRVLYVNYDLDNLNEFRRKIKILGLKQYLYDLTKNVDNTDDEEVISVNKYEPFESNKISDLKVYDYLQNRQIYGYTYSYVVEQMAIRKYKKITDSIILEDNLERFEVDVAYRTLKEIESCLKKVDPIPNNIWGTLSSAKKAPSADEIIKRTYAFETETKNIIKFLNNVEKKFHLHPIDTVSSFHSLNKAIICFESVKPMPCWIDDDFRNISKQALKDISTDIETVYSCNSFYREQCIKGYLPGTVEKYFKIILSNRYHIVNANSPDARYVDALLSTYNSLCELVKHIKKWVSDSVTCYNVLKKYFNYESHNLEQFILFNKLLKYLKENELDDAWCLEFVEHPKDTRKKADILNEEFNKLETIKSSLLPYLTLSELSFLTAGEIVNNKHYVKSLKKYVNLKKIKKDNLSFNKICSSFKSYYEQCELIKNMMPTKTSFNLYDDQTWKAYLNYLHFISKLSAFEVNSMIYLFKNGLKQPKASKEELISNLYQLREYQEELEKIENSLSQYHIQVAGDNYLDSVYFIKDNLNYLDQVIDAIRKIKHIFLKKNIKTKDILLLKEVDNRYSLAHTRMKDNSENYQQLFGSAYKKFETSTIEIGQSIDYFKRFKDRIIPSAGYDIVTFVKKMFSDHLFDQLIENLGKYLDIYNKWYDAFRDFTACFFRGCVKINEKYYKIINLQNNTFEETLDFLQIFIKKINQVELVYKIECLIDTFYRFKLMDLPKGIQAGRYGIGIADIYYYQTMHNYYQLMKEKENVKFDLNGFNKACLAFDEAEGKYAETNLFNLRYPKTAIFKNKNNQELRMKVLKNKTLPYDKGIFVCDVDVFNSLDDLEFFDLVIIDDAHLSTSNKYAKILDAKQVIVFGDRMFQTSATNTLMQRIKTNYFIKLRKRYIQMRNDFDNEWHLDNNFIYSPQTKIKVTGYDDLKQMVLEVVKAFDQYKDTIDKRTYNIIVATPEQRREVYQHLVTILKQEYSTDETIKIIDDIIRIGMFNSESVRVASELYLLYDDIASYDEITKQLIKRNYIVASKEIHLCYLQVKNSKQNEQMLASIQEFIGKPCSSYGMNDEVIEILEEELIKKGLNVERGYGNIALNIKTQTKNIGIIIYNESVNNYYSMIDNYLYFVKEYQKYGWEIKQYSMEMIAESIDDVLTDIINAANQEL